MIFFYQKILQEPCSCGPTKDIHSLEIKFDWDVHPKGNSLPSLPGWRRFFGLHWVKRNADHPGVGRIGSDV
jgi:hypothetical protein